MKALSKIFAFLFLSAVFTTAVDSVAAKTADSRRETVRRQIVGTWQLRQTISNVNNQKTPTRTVEAEPANNFSAPESLVLAADDEFGEITINEGFEKVIHTQTLLLNTEGEKRDSGAIVKAFWNNKKLVVQAVAINGTKMTEIFELGAGKNQLKVTLRLDEAKKSKSIVTRRIYERTAEQSGVEQTTAEINVSQYLL